MEVAGPFVVHNRTRGATLAANVRLADTPRSRRIGLLKHESLTPGEGLWIYPTQAIHTFGMRFPIDVAFLDRSLRVKRVYHGLTPFRLTSLVWGAQSVLELASGSLASTGTAVGDELQFSPLARCTIARCTMKSATLLMILMLASGCVRSTITHDFGLPASQRKIQQAPASPDALLRSIFQQQTVGAFNPVTGDRRIQTLETRLALMPQDAAARLDLAGIYENYGLRDDAFEQYTAALKVHPSEPAALGVARSARATGRSVEAIPLIEAYIQLHPSANSWNELGLLYGASGNLKAGESALREAVTHDAESDRMHNNLGYNLLLQNNAAAAEIEFRRALELNPKSATTRNNLGGVLARRGDLAGALEQFQSASDAATAHNNLAVVLLEAGQYEQSRQELVKALAIRHYFAPALANFKLVQERIRVVVASQKASGPLSAE